MYRNLRHFRIPGQRQVKPLDRSFRISTQMHVLQTRLTYIFKIKFEVEELYENLSKHFNRAPFNDHFTQRSTCVRRVPRQ